MTSSTPNFISPPANPLENPFTSVKRLLSILHITAESTPTNVPTHALCLSEALIEFGICTEIVPPIGIMCGAMNSNK